MKKQLELLLVMVAKGNDPGAKSITPLIMETFLRPRIKSSIIVHINLKPCCCFMIPMELQAHQLHGMRHIINSCQGEKEWSIYVDDSTINMII